MKALLTCLLLLLSLSPLGAEDGLASWYGPGFHGKKTASGEIYDQEKLTAAHKTLRFGSVVEVTDPGTGASVQVTINDRGPFVQGRIIDLSAAAARALGLTPAKGVMPVRLRLVSGAQDPGPEAGLSFVQVGAYRTEANARQTMGKLTTWGYEPKLRLGDFYRVYLGPLSDEAAERAESDLKLRGLQTQKRSTPPPGYD